MTDAPITRAAVSAYTVPTDGPESDGTIAWDSTTLVLVELQAGGAHGIGWTYGDRAAARLVHDTLRGKILGANALDPPALTAALCAEARNLGRPGLAAGAISAVDIAAWDLKARLLNVSLLTCFGALRARIPAYGSGGFTSYSNERLSAQLAGWAAAGFARVKMKVGRDPPADPERVRVARAAIGRDVELFVDANGAYTAPQARALAEGFARAGVTWFEEPVSSDDLAGLAELRRRAPAGVQIAAGEYGYDPQYFLRMLSAGAVDVLQVDATRALGFTGFLQAAALCEAFQRPLSAHCAPTLHAHVACAAPRAVHVEYFHDHARIESLFFDGAPRPERGQLAPDRARPGLGLDFKRADARRFQVGDSP